MKCVLIRVKEPKPPNSFRITSDYLICNDPGGTGAFADREPGGVWGHVRSLMVFSQKNHDMMVLKTSKWYQTSPGEDASIDTQRDLPKSIFQADLSWSLCTYHAICYDLWWPQYWPDPTKFVTKLVGPSTNYQTPFAVCRYDSWFSRSDGGSKSIPLPARFSASLLEPARNRVKYLQSFLWRSQGIRFWNIWGNKGINLLCQLPHYMPTWGSVKW